MKRKNLLINPQTRKALNLHGVVLLTIQHIAPKASYKPEINQISEKLMMNKNSTKKGKDIWNYLHGLDKQLQEKRDRTHLEKKLQEELDCLNGCTFQPEIISNYLTYDDIYKRTLLWKQNIEEKYLFEINFRIKKKRDKNEQEQEKECIFKPEISTKLEQVPMKDIKGLEQFIERQKTALDARKEKAKLEYRNSGESWISLHKESPHANRVFIPYYS